MSRLAPRRAPSGPKTELHECANEVVSDPPHDSSPALRSATPDSVACVCTGNVSDGFVSPSFSAAASVMILNEEPGGCGPLRARPATPSTFPVRGWTTAIAPWRSPRAETAADCSDGRIVVLTERPRLIFTLATTRLPNH